MARRTDEEDDKDIEAQPSASEELAPLPPSTEDNFDPEYDASEEIAQESADLMPPIAAPPQAAAAPQVPFHTPVPIPMPEMAASAPLQKPQDAAFSKYQALMNDYRRLQDNQQNGNLLTGILTGAAQIGQGMAGKYSGNFKPDMTGVQAVQKIVDQPLKSYDQKQLAQAKMIGLQDELQSRDPSSRMSQVYRDYAKNKFNLDINDSTSAYELSQLLKSIGKPQQSKFQQVYGSQVMPDGTKQKFYGKFDTATGNVYDLNNNPATNVVKESLTPFQISNDEFGQRTVFDKGAGKITGQIDSAPALAPAAKPTELYHAMPKATRQELDTKIVPAFNKETEKTQQRLTHVPVILQRLDEAQENPAALPQLKAELARFDVGDQRLAQQEFDMFAKRHGYKGWNDSIAAMTTGTITADYANDLRKAINGVEASLRGELNRSAEKQAKLLRSRLPTNQQIPVQRIAPLVYGEYQPTYQLKEKKSGKMVPVKPELYDQALKSGLFEE